MDRKCSSDVLPNGNLFNDLMDFTDTGYFDNQILGESWQQTCHEMIMCLLEEPPGLDEFRQEEPSEEPGKCGNSPQKPPECDNLPKEMAWAQPPSPPTSLPSQSPSTTYTIRPMSLMPLSYSYEPTGMSPETTGMSPQMTGISHQMTDISPQMTATVPQIIGISQQITNILPQMNGMSPQEMPSPVPVLHAKPCQSCARDHKNGHHCDFPNCNKVFTARSSLNRHKKLHTGEKPFLCMAESCEWRFARFTHLIRHIRSKHTASKPFHCRHCDKSFARSDYRVKHETVYCGVRRELQRKNK